MLPNWLLMLVLLQNTLRAVEVKMQSWYLDEKEMGGWESVSSIEYVNFSPIHRNLYECAVN